MPNTAYLLYTNRYANLVLLYPDLPIYLYLAPTILPNYVNYYSNLLNGPTSNVTTILNCIEMSRGGSFVAPLAIKLICYFKSSLCTSPSVASYIMYINSVNPCKLSDKGTRISPAGRRDWYEVKLPDCDLAVHCTISKPLGAWFKSGGRTSCRGSAKLAPGSWNYLENSFKKISENEMGLYMGYMPCSD